MKECENVNVNVEIRVDLLLNVGGRNGQFSELVDLLEELRVVAAVIVVVRVGHTAHVG